MYPQPPVVQDHVERGAFTGERIQTVTYMCERPGAVTLPALSLPWWDVEHQTDFPPSFEQATPYNSLGSLAFWSREGVEASAYILRKLLGDGNGVPNASRITF